MTVADRDHPEAQILAAWARNARPWTTVVRSACIASRRDVTDAAVVDAVCQQQPATVIDLGCGEGWLVRALVAQGLVVLGVDGIPELIEAARAAGGGRYRCLDYAAVAAGGLDETADVVVCNFSLLGGASVDELMHTVPTLLNPGGALIIQTLHPVTACGDAAYEDGWRDGTWAGIEGDFSPAPPWYFRTVRSWERLVADSGLTCIERQEPMWSATGQPASLLMVARRASDAGSR